MPERVRERAREGEAGARRRVDPRQRQGVVERLQPVAQRAGDPARVRHAHGCRQDVPGIAGADRPPAGLPERVEPLPLAGAVQERPRGEEIRQELPGVGARLGADRRRLLRRHAQPPGQAQHADAGLGGQRVAFGAGVELAREVADAAPVTHGVHRGAALGPDGRAGVPAGRRAAGHRRPRSGGRAVPRARRARRDRCARGRRRRRGGPARGARTAATRRRPPGSAGA